MIILTRTRVGSLQKDCRTQLLMNLSNSNHLAATLAGTTGPRSLGPVKGLRDIFEPDIKIQSLLWKSQVPDPIREFPQEVRLT